MDYLYSLYDALVSINVPNDKARAVVDAMERDMATTIATKTDLELLRQQLTARMDALGTRMDALATREEMLAIRAEQHESNALLRKDLQLLGTSMTVRLGSMLVLGLGLLFAALRLV